MDVRGCGRDRGRKCRQPQGLGGDQGSAVNQNREPRIEVGNQVATPINRMTDILERLTNRQGPEPVNQLGGLEREVDKALARFQKFSPPKFLGEPNPEIAKSWLERIVDIFAALNYTEDRQVTFTVFQLEGATRAWWNVVRTKWERDQIQWIWANFVREFNNNTFPL